MPKGLVVFDRPFFSRDCVEVARDLVGKLLIHRVGEEELRVRISETEAYVGESDSACHAHRGKTRRTEVMYGEAGLLYVYLCYGLHYLVNVVTGVEGQPEAVLLRAAVEAPGPGRLSKALGIGKDYHGVQIVGHPSLWFEDDGFSCQIMEKTRVGIGYARQEDRERLWRYVMLS